MRLPTIEGQGDKIDQIKAQSMVDYALANGINYFDTAYRYHTGESELFLGRALSRYPRDSYYLATKMPGHMMEYNNGQYHFTGLLASFPSRSPAEIFEEQLAKLQTDYFDFYLLHNVCETSWDFYTNEEINVIPYLLKQKELGRIRHLGFSAHGRAETIDKFLTKYNCFEFVQIQLNYLDWVLQEAGQKYEVITRHGLPVISMESVRGGRLVNLPAASEMLLKNERPDDTVASWAFRFLQSLPNVQVVLSGMSTMDQLKENIATFSKNDPTSPEERELLNEVIKPLLELVPCTGCRYCIEGCPQNLDIPKLLAMYNEVANADRFSTMTLGITLKAMTDSELPSNCIDCGQCTQICPQSIEVAEILRKFTDSITKRK